MSEIHIFTKFQDGGFRHLEFWEFVAISLLLDQFLPSLVGLLRIWHKTQLSCQNPYSSKFKMAAAAILNFEKLLPFLHNWTDPHHIWWECCKSYIERTVLLKNSHSATQDGGSRHLEFRKTVAIYPLLDRSTPNLIGISQIRYGTQLSCRQRTFTQTQDGGCHHLEMRTSFAIPLLFYQFSFDLVGMLQIRWRLHLLSRNWRQGS